MTRNGDIKKCVLVEGVRSNLPQQLKSVFKKLSQQVREGGRPKSGDVVLVKSQVR